MRRYGLTIPLILALAVFVWMPVATHAQTANVQGVVDTLLARYKSAGQTWTGTIENAATKLFWILALISLSWTCISMGIKRADLMEICAELCRFIMFTGFFFWLLLNGATFANDIVNSARQVGGDAAGTGQAIFPGKLINLGMQVYQQTLTHVNWLQPESIVAPIIIAVILLIVCALIAVNMMLLLCGAWIVLYAGLIFLGFGGCRWTSDMAINYYRTVLGVGVSLMTMQLIIGIGVQFLQDLVASTSQNLDAGKLGILMCATIILAVISHRLPQMVAGMVVGGGHNGAIGGIGVMTFIGAVIAGTSLARSMGGGAGAAAIAEGTSQSARLLEERIAAAEAAIGAGSGSGAGASTESVVADNGSRPQPDQGPYWPGASSGNRAPRGGGEREAMGGTAASKVAGKPASSPAAASAGGVMPSIAGKAAEPPEPPQMRPMTADEARGYPPEVPGQPIDWEDEKRRIVRGDGNFWKPEA
jgi:type IV secretion system protein TrbL